jgi:hypothetical protein
VSPDQCLANQRSLPYIAHAFCIVQDVISHTKQASFGNPSGGGFPLQGFVEASTGKGAAHHGTA